MLSRVSSKGIVAPILASLASLPEAGAIRPLEARRIAVAETPLGPVAGIPADRPGYYDGVEAFLGIKYASVPERFARSKLLVDEGDYNNGGWIDATDFGPWCWQSGVPPKLYYGDQEQDEECLSLNIWRPEGTDPSARLPVMVYVHGGAYSMGSGAEDGTQPHNFAREGFVAISINYRLGVFGFLPTDDQGSDGMNGLDDQAKALEWIHRNVEYFGGDPEAVTVFGQSSGSASVCFLSVNPAARGMFHRSIMESGECLVEGDSRPGGFGLVMTVEDGWRAALDIAKSFGAESIGDLSRRDAFPAADLAKSPGVNPTLDTSVFPDLPLQLLRDPTNLVPSQLLVGSNTYDNYQLPFVGVTEDLNAFEQEIRSNFPNDDVEDLIEAYSPDNYGGSVMNAHSQYHGDMAVTCNARQFAAYAAKVLPRASVHLYHFGAFTRYDLSRIYGLFDDFNNTDPTWASHGAEVPYVFGNFEGGVSDECSTCPYLPQGGPTDAERALHREMMSRWTSFARTGSPNSGEYGGWSPVPRGGADADGSATEIDYLFFASDGGTMSSGAQLERMVERCGAFPKLPGFRPSLAEAESAGYPSISRAGSLRGINNLEVEEKE